MSDERHESVRLSLLRHDEIEEVLCHVHGDETALWMRRWRWFFLATAGLFGYAEGSEWGVSHYRMKAATQTHAPQKLS